MKCCKGLQQILHHQRLRLFSLQSTPPLLLGDHTCGLVLVTQDCQPDAFLHWFTQHPQPWYFDGLGHKASAFPTVECTGIATYCLICPLYSMHQQLLGCLLVEHQHAEFSESDLALLQILAQQLSTTWCSLTMQAQLNQATTKRTAELEREVALRTRAGDVQHVLFEISSMASSAPNRQSLYQQLHQSISSLLMAKNFVIALYDAEQAEITLEYFRDQFDQAPHQKSFPVGRAGYQNGHRVFRRQPAVVKFVGRSTSDAASGWRIDMARHTTSMHWFCPANESGVSRRR